MLSESSKPHWLAPDDFLRGVPWAATETDRQPVGEITQGKLGAKIPYPRLLPGDSRVAVDTYEASQTAAGVRLELDADGGRVELGFDCDPSRVDLRKEAAGVEVEVWFGGSKIDSRPVGAGFSVVTIELAPGENVVYLPEGMGPEVKSLRPLDGALQPAQAKPRWLVYGDSITSGWVASSPALTWPARVARELGLDLLNLGFAGAARGEGVLAEQIVQVPDLDLIALAYGTNCWNRLPKSVAQVKADLEAFLQILRSGGRDIPILLISPILRPDAEESPNLLGATLQDLRAAIEAIAVRASGVELLGGLELVSPEQLPDGIHPGDEGHAAMAAAVAARVSSLIPIDVS